MTIIELVVAVVILAATAFCSLYLYAEPYILALKIGAASLFCLVFLIHGVFAPLRSKSEDQPETPLPLTERPPSRIATVTVIIALMISLGMLLAAILTAWTRPVFPGIAAVTLAYVWISGPEEYGWRKTVATTACWAHWLIVLASIVARFHYFGK